MLDLAARSCEDGLPTVTRALPPATKAIAAAAEISVTAVAVRRYDKTGCFIDLEIIRVE
jgi:hypothetical protein